MTPGAPPESFDVGEWLRRHPEASFKSVDPSEYFAAQRIGKGWTKRGDSIRFDEASGLACLKFPTPLDLNSNIEAYIAKEEGISKLAGVETVILAGEAAKSAIEGFDVVTFRNNLNKILGTVYDSRAPWTVDGCVHGSTLFLDITEQPKDEITNGWQRTDLGKKLVAWGYQFEAACTGKAAGDATSEYGTLVEAKLGNNLQLIIGAEIDAYDPSLVEFSAQEGGRGVESGVPPLSSLVELKTFKLPAHKGQHRTLYRFKHARWWIQSFLAGTPGLVLGQRDDEVNTAAQIFYYLHEQGALYNVHARIRSALPATACIFFTCRAPLLNNFPSLYISHFFQIFTALFIVNAGHCACHSQGEGC